MDDYRNTLAAAPDAEAVRSIPKLVAEVYEAAPPAERSRLVEQLLRPLGVLSLFGVAGGIFANIRFRSSWPEPHIRTEDLSHVHAAQVATLVEHVQQVSVEAVDGLAQMLVSSPAISGSAAALMLVAVLVQRARLRESLRAAAEASVPPSNATGPARWSADGGADQHTS